MKQKLTIIGIAILMLLGIGVGIGIYIQPQAEISVEEYETTVSSLINNVRSGQEKWRLLLDEGGDFQDLCTGFYSQKIRILGAEFIEQAATFEALRVSDGPLDQTIPNYAQYQQFFATYHQIGTYMIQFADHVDKGEYTVAITILEQLIAQYDMLPSVY